MKQYVSTNDEVIDGIFYAAGMTFWTEAEPKPEWMEVLGESTDLY